MIDLDANAMEHMGRPSKDKDPVDLIEYCLDALADDDEHELQDDVVAGLTYEDLIDTLRCAMEELNSNRDGP